MPPKLITKPVPTAEAERRLGPALECLFNGPGNPKQALKHATQAESKRPGWPAARALRALALRRLDRPEEAQVVAEAVLSDIESRAVPADEDAAVKLHLYFREAPRQEALSARAYEAVARASEGDAYMAESSFFFHLRASDWAGAQRIATRLQRMSSVRSKEEYGLWTAAAIWLGTRSGGNDGDGVDRLRSLAGALVKRSLSSMPAPSAEVARFATRLLCDVRNFEAAKEIWKNEKLVIDAAEAAHLTADIAFQSGDLTTARKLLQQMLADRDPDDWGHWVRYLGICEATQAEGGVEEAQVLVRELCGRVDEMVSSTRGQFIADLELRRRLAQWDDLRAKSVAFFKRFGSKSVCAHDLRPYVLALCGEGRIEAATLCEQLEDELVEESHSMHINLCWIRLWLGCLEDTAGQLFARYEKLLAVDLESTERQEGDDYILLAAHQLVPVVEGCDRYSRVRPVLQAIVLIEAGLVRSPYNFHFKLLLVQLYKAVGAAELAVEMWMSLEVKHVQMATLSHLVMRSIVEHGCHSLFAPIDTGFKRLWAESERDIPESVSRAFASGSLNAAIEFMEFRERLERSKSMVEAVIFQSLIHVNPGMKGDMLGVERAWDVVGNEDARFVPNTLALDGAPLVANEDVSCMEFWDLEIYDPCRSRADMDTASVHEGQSLPRSEHAQLLVDFLILRCVLRLAARGKEDKSDLALLKTARTAVSRGNETESPRTAYMCTLLTCIFEGGKASDGNVQYIEAVTERLKTDAISVDCRGEEVRCLSAQSIAVAGEFVYETLTLTSLALASLGMVKTKARSKSQTSALAALYVDAVKSACVTLIDLVTPVAKNDQKLFPNDANEGGHSMSYLPATINNETAEEFCKRIGSCIHTSHVRSVDQLLEALNALMTRIKMMDGK